MRFWLFLPTLLLTTTLWANERVLVCTDIDGSGRGLDKRCPMVADGTVTVAQADQRPTTPCECNFYGCADCPFRCKVRPWRVRLRSGTDIGGCRESPPNCVWVEKMRAKALEKTVCSNQGRERTTITKIKTRDLVVEHFQGACPPIGLREEVAELRQISIRDDDPGVGGPLDPHAQCADYIRGVQWKIDHE